MSDQAHTWAFRISDTDKTETLGLLGMVRIRQKSEGTWACERYVPALDDADEWAWDVTSGTMRASDERDAVCHLVRTSWSKLSPTSIKRGLIDQLDELEAASLLGHPGMESIWDVPERAYLHTVDPVSFMFSNDDDLFCHETIIDARDDADEHVWARMPVHGHPLYLDIVVYSSVQVLCSSAKSLCVNLPLHKDGTLDVESIVRSECDALGPNWHMADKDTPVLQPPSLSL